MNQHEWQSDAGANYRRQDYEEVKEDREFLGICANHPTGAARQRDRGPSGGIGYAEWREDAILPDIIDEIL